MPTSNLLVDSSFLIAFYYKDTDEHEAVKEVAELYRLRLLVPQVVLTEVVYYLKRETGVRGAIQFLEEFSASEPRLQEVTVPDLRRAKEIMQRYTTAKFDFVDTAIMAFAERLNVTLVGTLDRRDFLIFRPGHVDNLILLP